MRKATKIWMIVATSLLLAGGILFAAVMTVLEWDFTKLSTERIVTNTHEVREPYRHISVTTDTADLELILSDGESTSVVCHESAKATHRIEARDGTLFIELTDTREWYDHINIGFADSPKITVYLPAGMYGALSVKGSTGDVRIPSNLSFASMDIAVSTGDVSCQASADGDVKVKAGTGSIAVENMSAQALFLSVSTGDVTVSDVTVHGNMTVSVSTGKSRLTHVTCKNFTSEGNTGDIIMTDVVVAEGMSINRSTGDVKFDRCDAAEIEILTDTGDVTGTLISEKVFTYRTDTGDVKLPESTTGGRCKITTDTGDIRITNSE